MNNTREQDVVALAKAVLTMGAEHWDNPNGAYESTCPLCYAKVHRGGQKEIWASMSEIKHEPNCAYLIAKDLLTNFE